MSQNDYTIANDTAANVRADINLALQALASQSSGATAPSTTYANMMWYDTTANILKMRSEADDAWINLGTLDQSTNTFTPSGVPTASETVAGIVELSTTAENTTGTATDRVPTVAGVVAMAEAKSPIKAWVNFNGTGVVAIRGSLNVSSITDNSAGNYTVNFTNAISDTNYAVAGSGGASTATLIMSPVNQAGLATGSVNVALTNTSALNDNEHVSVVVIR